MRVRRRLITARNINIVRARAAPPPSRYVASETPRRRAQASQRDRCLSVGMSTGLQCGALKTKYRAEPCTYNIIIIVVAAFTDNNRVIVVKYLPFARNRPTDRRSRYYLSRTPRAAADSNARARAVSARRPRCLNL